MVLLHVIKKINVIHVIHVILETVSQVSDVDYGPFVRLYFIISRL